MKTLDALRTITDLLAAQHIEEPQAKAKVIVSHVQEDLDFFADVSDKAWSSMVVMADKVSRGEPVEYVTGKAYFRYLELDVSPDVLIPRKETELVAELAKDLILQNGYSSVLDMCTGSGCIAISIATETRAKVSAADISEKAVLLAQNNAIKNNADVEFFISDMFSGVSGEYDLIVCNPPYISDIEYEQLNESVKDYEPKNALAAGDGLYFYRIIAKQAAKHIKDAGALVLEIGADQAIDVMELLEEDGFIDIEHKKDYQGRDRIVKAIKGR